MNPSQPSPAGLDRLKKSPHSPPTRTWKPLAAGLCFFAAFAFVLWGLFGDQLRAATPVKVTRALLLPASDPSLQTASSSEVLFQSSGWIEPDPWTVHVATLADGIVEEVLFQEGDLVKKDQVLAKLVAEDAELALANAKALLEEADHLCKAHAAGTEASRQQVAIALPVNPRPKPP